MVEHVSEILDRVIEQVMVAYESARERWLHNRSAWRARHPQSMIRLSGSAAGPSTSLRSP
jgi:hypothetical protein